MNQSAKAPASGWLRAGLAFLAFTELMVGCWAFFAPASFFTSFPLPGHPWVALLPPYNEHLVRDIGAFNMSFAFLFIWAMVSCEKRLVQAILIGWLVFTIPHFIFHAVHLAHFPLADQIMQTILLGIFVLLPLALLMTLPRSQPQRMSLAKPSEGMGV